MQASEMNQSQDSKKQMKDDMEMLKEWLEKQPHLPHDVDDEFLHRFILGTKTLEIAKQKLDAWFSSKKKFPQLLSSEVWIPFSPEMKDNVKAVEMFFLPKLSPEGYLVQWCNNGEDMSVFNHKQTLIRSIMQLEVGMHIYPECKGYICVCDMAGLQSTSFLAKISPTSVGANIHWFQTACPMKLKNLIMFNSSSAVETLINTVFKPFMKAKLFSRITVTTEGENGVSKYLPTDMLPENYGGNEKHSQLLNEEWQRKLEEKADWLQEISKLVSDEKKRPADKNSTYGVEGTFRKLAFD